MDTVAVVATTNNFQILDTVDITKHNLLNELYEHLLSLKKDEFADNERIVLVYRTENQKKLLDELITVIDIPEFFLVYEQTENQGGLDWCFPDNFCIYPWINLRVFTTGDTKPCCVFRNYISDGNINNKTLKELYQGDFMSNLRQSFLKNEKPKPCIHCWELESAGHTSLRLDGKHKLKESYYRLNYLKDDFNNLKQLDLNLGNHCNLACNICDRDSSSTIAQNDLDQGIISIVEFNNLKHQVRWAETDEFWNQLLEIAPNIKYLDLYGGEPLMSKTHFKFLQKLIDNNFASDIKIDYNSNGTMYSERFFDYWKHFKEVKISFSIDDIENRFEEQRVGANWLQVCDNIKKFNEHQSDKFLTEIYPTINTQNVFWIPELIDWINQQGVNFVSWNILDYPDRYNIRLLSKQEKIKIVDKLKNFIEYNICNVVINLLDVTKTVDN